MSLVDASAGGTIGSAREQPRLRVPAHERCNDAALEHGFIRKAFGAAVIFGRLRGQLIDNPVQDAASRSLWVEVGQGFRFRFRFRFRVRVRVC